MTDAGVTVEELQLGLRIVTTGTEADYKTLAGLGEAKISKLMAEVDRMSRILSESRRVPASRLGHVLGLRQLANIFRPAADNVASVALNSALIEADRYFVRSALAKAPDAADVVRESSKLIDETRLEVGRLRRLSRFAEAAGVALDGLDLWLTYRSTTSMESEREKANAWADFVGRAGGGAVGGAAASAACGPGAPWCAIVLVPVGALAGSAGGEHVIGGLMDGFLDGLECFSKFKPGSAC